MNFTVFKPVHRRGWWVRNDVGLLMEWGPFLTRWGALRVARRLKRRDQTPEVRV